MSHIQGVQYEFLNSSDPGQVSKILVKNNDQNIWQSYIKFLSLHYNQNLKVWDTQLIFTDIWTLSPH
jgi:hypothetical protein